MNIVNDSFGVEKISGAEIENVQLQKIEYTTIGRFVRKRGYKLYAYDMQNLTLSEVDVIVNTSTEIVVIDGKLKPSDKATSHVVVDNKKIYFEALNMKNAQKRLDRFKSGQIKELFNLKKPATINLF